MDGLYTFNSNELEISTRRPASTDNPPTIRKRIIKSILSKKPSHFAESPLRIKDLSTPTSTDRQTPVKKVTFNLDSPSPIRHTDKKGIDLFQMTKKVKALKNNQINECIAHMLSKKLEPNRYPLEDIKNERDFCRAGKRSVSSTQNGRLNAQLKGLGAERQEESFRSRRIASLKLSPKIVPISDDKLPKAFKVKYLVNNSMRQPQKKKIRLRQILSCQVDKKIKEERALTADEGIRRLQRLLIMEEKIFSSLYRLRQ